MNRPLVLSALFVALSIAACEEPRRFTDDDDDDFTTGSVGNASASGQGGTGAGGAAAGGAGAGGAGGASMASTGVTSATSSTSSGMAGGICDTGVSYGSQATDACLTASCCEPFHACMADINCVDCLEGEGIACDTFNDRYIDFTACFDTNCPHEICDSGLGVTTDGNPDYDCMQCINGSCCDAWDDCAPGGGPRAIDTCVACVNDIDSATCMAASSEVQAGAAAFLDCQASACASVCSL